MTNNHHKQKHSARKYLTSLRNALTPEKVYSNSNLICKNIIRHHPNIQQLNTGLYLPFGNEVDLRSLLLASGHHFFIPSVQNKEMQFQRWQSDLTTQRHSLGMQQPEFDAHLHQAVLDICFMPLLGFDDQGHRLGMGGGFYDRFFANNSGTLLIGVAHDCQHWSELPHDDWDVKLHAIITESQYITFNS